MLHVAVAVTVTVIMPLLSFFKVIHLTIHIRSEDPSQKKRKKEEAKIILVFCEKDTVSAAS